MTLKRQKPGWTPKLRHVALASVLALAACNLPPPPGTPGITELQTSTEFSLARVDQAWATPAGGIVAMQRPLGGESEQIIGLVNNTAMEGDNFLWLRARVPNGITPGRFKLDDFVKRIDGIPPPFGGLSDRDLRSASDALGTFFWLEYRTGTDTNCVLAFRRIDASDRVLPKNSNVLEIMLRNCINGSVEDALNPIRASQIAVGAIAGAQIATGGSRMLSPLAAPSP